MRNLEQVDTEFDAFALEGESPVPFPFELSFVDSESSPTVQTLVQDHLIRLSHHYDRITFAHVFIRIPHKHRHNRLFHVHVQIDVPGRRLMVSRDPDISDKHADVRVALRDAFNKVSRQLEDFVKSRHGYKARRHHESI